MPASVFHNFPVSVVLKTVRVSCRDGMETLHTKTFSPAGAQRARQQRSSRRGVL